MTARFSLYPIVVLLIGLFSGPAFGQQYYPQQQPAQQYPQAAGPQRPVYQQPGQGTQPIAQPQQTYPRRPAQTVPANAGAVISRNTPTLQRRNPAPVNKAFTPLTPAQQAELDAFLKRWEEASRKQKRITIEFNRFELRPAYAPPTEPEAPVRINQGKADFEASGKWMWKVDREWVDGKLVDSPVTEHFVCDGRSLFEYKAADKTVIQHVMADEMKGHNMVRAMLPFLFTTDVKKLKDRYFLSLVPFADPKIVCIKAEPRYQKEAANFVGALMLVDLTKMEPTGMQIFLPGGTDSFKYQFTKVEVNPKNPSELFSDPFKGKIPSGWTSSVEQMSEMEMTNRPPAGPTR